MKNKYTIVKLKFKSPMHISSGGSGNENSEDYIHSDTLFSSICSATKLLYGDSEVERLISSENLFISSAFPFYKDIYFFPKPLGYYRKFDRYEDEKNFKKINYFSKEIFEKIINKLPLEDEFHDYMIVNKCYSEEVNKDSDIISITNEIPRVTIDRINNSTMIYHFTEIRFAENAGLYFLFNCDDEEVKKLFISSLKLLGDEGIGADNTVGKGLFDIEEDEIEIYTPEESDKIVLLSLYSPIEEELKSFEALNSNYNFLTRRGWVSSFSNMNLRRKSIRMFSEGSILKFKGMLIPKGKLVVVLDKSDLNFLSHNIYRYGKAFTIPVK